MNASIGQCVALVKYAQAFLRNEGETLEWQSNPWFEHIEDYRFGVGKRGGQILADDPNAWFKMLAEQGFSKVALFVEPDVHPSDVYMTVGFAGGGRWAPLTIHLEGHEVIWHERPEFEKRGDSGVWHEYRGGFSVQAGQDRVHATVQDASRLLDEALEAIGAFQREHRPDEKEFGAMFSLGRHLLRTAGLTDGVLEVLSRPEHVSSIAEVQRRARLAFPRHANPQAVELVAAVEGSWAIGGMGWWNDWNGPNEPVIREYLRVTGDYYKALTTAVAAACEPSD